MVSVILSGVLLLAVAVIVVSTLSLAWSVIIELYMSWKEREDDW